MALLKLQLDDVAEKPIVTRGRHELKILSAKKVVFSSGRPGIQITLSAEDEPDAAPVFCNLFGLYEDDNEIFVANTQLLCKQFCVSFGISFEEFEDHYASLADMDEGDEATIDDWKGYIGTGTVKHEKDDTGEIRPAISRFVSTE